MSTYAAMKGRTVAAGAATPGARDSAELDEAERARVAGLRRLHREHLAAFEPFFRELYALGMVPGWRAIVRIDLKEPEQ